MTAKKIFRELGYYKYIETDKEIQHTDGSNTITVSLEHNPFKPQITKYYDGYGTACMAGFVELEDKEKTACLKQLEELGE